MNDDFTINALDSLAAVYRLVGHHGIMVEPVDQAEFLSQCEAWARHILTGAPAPGDDTTDLQPGIRQWTQAQRFLREWRMRELASIESWQREYAAFARETLKLLRQIAARSNETSDSIMAALSRIDALLEYGPIDRARAEFTTVAAELHALLLQQSKQIEDQIGVLENQLPSPEQTWNAPGSERHKLGVQLAALRREIEVLGQRSEINDPLAKVYNRTAFDVALPRYLELSATTSQSLALLMLDIKGMKTINSRFGREAGNQVIASFANSLTLTFLRADDFVARYSGDKFAALLFIAEPTDTKPLLERLADRLNQLSMPQMENVKVACSSGLALLTAEDDAASLLRRARMALQQNKLKVDGAEA